MKLYIGEHLKRLRLAKGLTQEEVAACQGVKTLYSPWNWRSIIRHFAD